MTIEIPPAELANWFSGLSDPNKSLLIIAVLFAVWYMAAAIIIRLFGLKLHKHADGGDVAFMWLMSPWIFSVLIVLLLIGLIGWIVSLGLIITNPFALVRSMFSDN